MTLPRTAFELPRIEACLTEEELAQHGRDCGVCECRDAELVCTLALSETADPRFVCVECANSILRHLRAAEEQAAQAALEPWQSELGVWTRAQRAQAINDTLWTTAEGSPLTAACQSEWRTWRVAMHRITLDYASPNDVIWPERPGYQFGE